jgi:SAM-dependent methyltransferase
MTSDASTGQVATAAAEVYEEFFVPALFRTWVGPMCDAAVVDEGQRVLDVACGTGVLARAARERVGPRGAVEGVDRNAGMLVVAERTDPQVTWRLGRAEQLPYHDDTFDATVSQFGLMFFEDQVEALREMRRVTCPGGRVAVTVWGPLQATPGYAAMVELLDRLFGDEAADALRAPYCLGDRERLADLFAAAGYGEVDVATRVEAARFPSIDDWVHTDVRGWTLADMLSDGQYQQLREAAHDRLAEFVQPDGAVRFATPAHVVTASVGSPAGRT